MKYINGASEGKEQMYPDDERFIDLIIEGDQKSFEVIYDRYHEQLFYMAVKYLKDKQLSEDAVQDIFVGLWDKRKKLDSSKSIRGFLFINLKNHILNIIRNRKNKKLVGFEFNEEDYPEQVSLIDEINYSEKKNIIEKGLLELPDQRRKIFEMKVFQEYSNSEIAEQLSISVNTVKVHYYHALKFIKSKMIKNSELQ